MTDEQVEALLTRGSHGNQRRFGVLELISTGIHVILASVT